MFGIILISIVSVFHLYTFWRLGSIPDVRRIIPLKIIALGGILLWSAFFLGRIYGHSGTSVIAAAMEFAGMNWMATLFLLSFTFLVIDLLTCFGLLFRKVLPTLRSIALAVGLLLALISLIQGLRSPVVNSYTAELKDLPVELDGMTLVAVSDLHIGNQLRAGWLERRVTRVMSEKPDIIVLLGDIYEGHERPAPEVLATMRKLKASLGVWAVLGNHEFYGGPEVIQALTDESGATVLRNSYQEIRPGLVLAGVEGKSFDRRPDTVAGVIESTLADVPRGAVILMSHKPTQAENAAEKGVGLMLSGHTHGGQIWPFGYLVKRFFPRISGKYLIEGMTLVVCRGTGTWGPRMRLWHPGEILKITLVRKNS